MDSEGALPVHSAGSSSTHPRLLRPDRWTVLGAVAVALSILGLTWFDRSTNWLLAVGGAAIFALLASGKALEKGLLLSIVVACLMPHEMISRGIRVELVMFVATALLFLNRAARRPPAGQLYQQVNWTERWVLLLFAAATIGAALGFSSGHPLPNVISEYALYLPIRSRHHCHPLRSQ